MSDAEARLLMALLGPDRRAKRKKLAAGISRYLGTNRPHDAVIEQPPYYGELLAWALDRHIQEQGWRIVKAAGIEKDAPELFLVDTGDGQPASLYREAVLYLEKGKSRLVLTVTIIPAFRAMAAVSSGPRSRKRADSFRDAVMSIMTERNFYRGAKLEFDGMVRIIKPQAVNWDSIVLFPQTRRDVKMNTTGFLKNYQRLAGFGIPPKRGVLLAGEPGTGKTLICKAIMTDSEGITCITVCPYDLDSDGYISGLYALAAGLAPAIVIFEDIDLIARSREESGYARAPALLALLNALDGVEACEMVVTVATTNHPEMLDKAIRNRPSRFDRIIRVGLPSMAHRLELVGSMTDRIHLSPEAQLSLVQRTEGCTPAQIKEVVYSMVMDRTEDGQAEGEMPPFTDSEIERAVARVRGGARRQVGFAPCGNGDSDARGNRDPLPHRAGCPGSY